MSLGVILLYTPQIIYAFSEFLEHTRDIKWGAGNRQSGMLFRKRVLELTVF